MQQQIKTPFVLIYDTPKKIAKHIAIEGGRSPGGGVRFRGVASGAEDIAKSGTEILGFLL